MTAEQARQLVEARQEVDNSAHVIGLVREAIDRDEDYVDLSYRAMTEATHRELVRLGYKITHGPREEKDRTRPFIEGDIVRVSW